MDDGGQVKVDVSTALCPTHNIPANYYLYIHMQISQKALPKQSINIPTVGFRVKIEENPVNAQNSKKSHW